MLRDDDPVMARAAMGDIRQPDEITANTKGEQLQQIYANLVNNPNKGDAKLDLKMLKEATKSFGYKRLIAKNGKWLLKGMNTAMYSHQVVAVRWMLGQEFLPRGPHGGILADQMGLGKTIEILACMCANRPSAEDKRRGRIATLIVAPATAIPQWMKEINDHCSFCFRKVHHYKSSQRINPGLWQDCDIV
jgi:SNF2 family DNA or RNA helicase